MSNMLTDERENKAKALSVILNTCSDTGSRYVYVHKNLDGDIFFVGNGEGDRATSEEHPSYWHHYVKEVLNNNFTIEIIKDNIDMESAVRIKDEILKLYPDQIINQNNYNRPFDMNIYNVYIEALESYKYELMTGVNLEEIYDDTNLAIQTYKRAYSFYIDAMNSRNYEASNIYLQAHYPCPPSRLVDRISFCYMKTNQFKELIDFSDTYFAYFCHNKKTEGERKLIKRTNKAKDNLGKKAEGVRSKH